MKLKRLIRKKNKEIEVKLKYNMCYIYLLCKYSSKNIIMKSEE